MPGIGEKRAAKLSAEGRTVHGAAFKASSAAEAPAKAPAKPAVAAAPKEPAPKP